ncbi:agmatine deiminase family protein [Roseibium sediminicola]|uniref:Agmatine deiminase family protein n=1 Tax=Roseibium sediminicola TaxID=2933272 RepID=A0ABT0GRH8_9HYPH|nr:agmatine deiminase family protein [Roseibium sp. CAU 1639]MCK7612050.1 agmatine deiminase family protein [Roseibium sp. CAU 1639]
MLTRRQFLKQTSANAAVFAALATGLWPMPSNATAPHGLPDGYFVPAEEDPHERTFMQWPVNRTVHPDRWFLADLQKTIANVANTIAEFEPVVMLMAENQRAAARRLLSGKVEIWDVPTDDLWCRDSGPLFAVDGNGGLVVSGIQFNGWGNKQVHDNDGLVAKRVAERMGLKIYPSGLKGEPGGAEWDGAGTLMAQESCWVNPNRNDLGRPEIEARLLAAYGADTMIWAPGVRGLDITDDHIDALARFVRPGTVLIQVPYPDDDDAFSVSARKTLSILQQATDASGQPLEIVEIASPTRTRVRSEDFVSSYVNYYVCNGAVICAQFGDSDTDTEAVEALARLYPDREIVSLNIDPIGETGGGIHCATQQQPATA